MALSDALEAHLRSGATTLCRCWGLTRKDGVRLGFTDHDTDLAFEGFDFRAGTGLTASALEQTSGLSVNNTEAVGALSSAAVTGADLAAGRYDGAGVTAWLVNWETPEERVVQFRGAIGEVSSGGGAFVAELRGLTEALNEPVGRVYQSRCSTVLGSADCGFDVEALGFHAIASVLDAEDGTSFRIAGGAEFADRWFDRGRFEVVDGAAAGLVGLVKSDRTSGAERRIELWERIGLPVSPGDRVRLEAGCDKRAETCRAKFDNFMNFRGFPSIPGEDWLMAYPASADRNDGGSLS
ncbi:MAG: DUF2163 domain-containing protein [Paracoccaceae bacterium]|nr:DUF2163 domain-containing protein [Paracoccaceae bacterium]